MKKIWKYLIFAFIVIALVSCNSCDPNTSSSNNQGSASDSENGSSTTPSGGNTENPSGGSSDSGSTSGGETTDGSESETPSETPDGGSTDTPSEDAKKVIIVYFSETGNTERVANTIASTIDGADMHKIEAAVPYTSADLNYNNSSCRANLEQRDDSARPEIANSVENLGEYDIVFLGYPIWWGIAPKIMYTFVENNDLSGKTVVPFCTSGSSGVGSSATNLEALKSDNGTWKPSRRFSSSASSSDIASWINSLDLGISAK